MKNFHLINYQKYKNYHDNFLYSSFILYYLVQLN